MPWKEIPHTDGWEVCDEPTWNGRHRFRHAIDRKPADQLIRRLNSLLGANFKEHPDYDYRITRKSDGKLEVSTLAELDFKLLCAPVDDDILTTIRMKWSRKKWEDLEEQKLLEKCLDELYENGALSEDTSAELKEYQALLHLDGYYMKEPDGLFDLETATCHSMFVQTGLNFELGLGNSDVRRIQKFADARITERYDLQTVRAVKRKQKELATDGRYKGEINGIWNEKMQLFLERFTREEELLREGRGIISSFGEMPQKGASSDPEKWAAYANSIIETHLKKLHQCFREKYGRDPVQGDQDELSQQIRGLNAIQTMIKIGLHNIEWAEQQLRRKEEEEWEEFWEEFFSEGGTWSRMRNQFQLECIELWISAACFAYDAAAVGSWVTRRFFGTQATRALQQSLARRPPSDLRFLQRLPAVGAARNRLKAELAKLGRKAMTSTGRKGSDALKRMAKKAGLKVVPGGNHWSVKNNVGRTITQIPYSLKKKGTARDAVRKIMAAAGF